MQLRDEDFDNVDPGKPRILVAGEGGWPAQFAGYETKHYGKWGEKLIFQWKVFTSIDKSKFETLIRYYNLSRNGGERFQFGPLHDFRKDWVAANGGRLPLNPSRLSLSIWKDRTFLVEVVTVRHDSKGKPISPSFYWSRIGQVIRPLEAGESWERLPLQPLNSAR
ncbi:MAG: hypothetical protein CAF45_016315 [Nitrospira sp. CG24E]|nr:MAG: hypothetical protein CAF45_016315 [Nitrospira sp. CG24E]